MPLLDVIEAYKKALPQYEKATVKNSELLAELITANKIIFTNESRTKSPESLQEKITRPGKNYKDPLTEVSDLCGLRIITNTLADLVEIEKIIESNFEVDAVRSVDKSKELKPNQFGYLSRHLIVRPHRDRAALPEWKEISEIWIEIQIRTILQHAWSSIDHILRYKHEDDVPVMLRRKLFRISALFEIADEEFDLLMSKLALTRADYDAKIEKGETRIEINVDSIKSFIEKSPIARYWIDYARRNIGQTINDNDWGDISRDVKFAKYFGLHYINEIEEIMNSLKGWGEEFLSDYYREQFRINNANPSQVSTVINGINTALLIAYFSDRIDAKTLNDQFGWGAGEYLILHSKELRSRS
jgi:ppGpp synthetase/RelA/SpoT-type nucleotidyltranferase